MNKVAEIENGPGCAALWARRDRNELDVSLHVGAHDPSVQLKRYGPMEHNPKGFEILEIAVEGVRVAVFLDPDQRAMIHEATAPDSEDEDPPTVDETDEGQGGASLTNRVGATE